MGILYGACAKLCNHAKHAHKMHSYLFGKIDRQLSYVKMATDRSENSFEIFIEIK
jgi:predicted metal-binding protein